MNGFKRLSLLCILFAYTSIAYAQKTVNSITYKATDKPIVEILQNIESLTHCSFSYNSTIIDSKKTKSVSFNNEPLESCLNTILGPNYKYTYIGNQVIITEKPNIATPTTTKKQLQKIEPTKPPQIITIYDTIPVYDTITTYITHTDTIRIVDSLQHIETITLERYIKNLLHSTNYCVSFSTYFGFGVCTSLFYNGGEYAKYLNDIHKSELGYNVGIDATYKHKNTLFTTGFSLYDCKLSNSYTVESYTDDPTVTYTDTLWYWDFTEISTYYKFNKSGDSVAVTMLDSMYTYTLRQNPKRIEHETEKLSSLSWQYIRIPLGIGYQYNIGNTLAIQPKISFSPMVLCRSKGEIPNKTLTGTTQIKSLLKPFTVSASISCDVIYSLEENFSIGIKPFCSVIPSIFKENVGFKSTVLNFGLEWGFYYTFPYELF